jgi:DNA topoisomerase-2
MTNTMKLKTFFDDEFRLYSIADCVRSIPSVIDGFKPSQRKCIYGMLVRGENAGEGKVAQLSGHVSAVSQYHHGENSLNETLIGLAQDYTGSNNLNYLKPNGQFGSRLSSEASAPRYIFTELSSSFRKIFKKEDDIILNYLEEDGDKIEPDFYLPIIPNILINGARGMGTGYATHILKHNPLEIRDNIVSILKRQTPNPILPWYRGFKGTVTAVENQITNTGCYEIVNSTTIRITELPIGVYLDDYKKHLFKLQDSGLIKDFDNNSTELSFDFIVSVPRATTQLTHEEIIAKFKLSSRDTQNLTAWTETGHIKVFEDVQEIIEHFVEFRLGKYEERRKKLIELLTVDLEWMVEKRRFIEFYLNHSKDIANKSKKELEQLLVDNRFVNISKLLDIRIYNLTKDDISKLETQIDKTTKDIELLNKTNCVKLYIKDLESLDV